VYRSTMSFWWRPTAVSASSGGHFATIAVSGSNSGVVYSTGGSDPRGRGELIRCVTDRHPVASSD